jgi:hypothetical protein
MSEAGIAKPENSHIWQREEHEHYVEPDWCSKRLFDVEKFEGEVWDPCCGFGRVCESARAAGYPVEYSDIVDRGYRPDSRDRIVDFFDCVDGDCANIVCNPPFDIFKDFALHALNIAKGKVAMIWLVRTLPAARWLQDTPLARIYFLTPRPSMPPGHTITAGEKPGGGKQDFCWLVWDHKRIGPPDVRWLHRDGAKATA